MDDKNFDEVYKKTNVALPLKNKNKCKLLFLILCVYSWSTYEFLRRLLSVSLHSRWNWNLNVLVLRRGENRSTRRKTSRSNWTELITNSTHIWSGRQDRIWTRVTVAVGGECSHHCATTLTLGQAFQLKKGTSSIQLSQLNLESHTEGSTNCTDSDKYSYSLARLISM